MTEPLRPVYEYLINGHSLATRLVATAMAKQGQKVLLVTSAPAADTLLTPSPQFERWRSYLGLEKCKRSADPLQIITPNCRFELHGRDDITAELARELPDEADAILALLEEWGEQGASLLNKLMDLPPAIGGFKTRLSFAAKALFALPYRHLCSAAEKIWPEGLSDDADQLLTALIEGFACCRIEEMSVAEFYLTVATALNPQTIDSAVLRRNLDLRFSQFHGQTTEPQMIKSLEYRSDSWELTTANNHHIRIGCYIDSALSPLIPRENASPSLPQVRLSHGPLGHPLPPSFRQRILIAGQPTIDLRLDPEKSDTHLTTITPSSPVAMAEKLDALFPFHQTEIQLPQSTEAPPCSQRGLFNGYHQDLHQRHGHYLCDPQLNCPHLHGIGDLLMADALLNCL